METRGILLESAANFRMIDIGAKLDTQRRAVASGVFFAAQETIARIRDRTLPKGDVLTLAEVAGIQGAKRTADLLPLCHPLALSSVRVWTEVADDCVRVFCEAKTVGKTGVEMEALCGVNAALLCIYDLTKGIDPVLRLGEIRLELKEGGKSGHWVHPGSSLAEKCRSTPSAAPQVSSFRGATAVVITLSDRCSRKEREDKSGPTAVRWLESHGAMVKSSLILPDDGEELRATLFNLLKGSPPDLVITTGGTGLSQRDITPETVLSVSRELGGREIPGIGELLRQEGAKHSRHAWLSRSTASLVHETVVLCLPGSPSAVQEGLDAVGNLLGHALHVGAGGGHG